MAIIERTYGKETNAVIDELLISSDSHVIEPEGLVQPLHRGLAGAFPGVHDSASIRARYTPSARASTRRMGTLTCSSAGFRGPRRASISTREKSSGGELQFAGGADARERFHLMNGRSRRRM